MKKVIINGIELNVSETEYKSYLSQIKAMKDLEKNSNKLDAKTPTRTVEVTMPKDVLNFVGKDYKGEQVVLLSNSCAVVEKDNVYRLFIYAHSPNQFTAIKLNAKEQFKAKFSGDFKNKVFTWDFENERFAKGFAYYQQNARIGKDLSEKDKEYNERLMSLIKVWMTSDIKDDIAKVCKVK